MNEHQLRCFIAAAQYLNFTKAAEDLYMTQAAMTYQIAEMEKSLKVRLFDREKGRVLLTEAGESFLTSAQAILHEMDRARQTAREVEQGTTDSLSIGCHGDVLFPLLPDVLKRFRELHPEVSVFLKQGMTSDIVRGLSDGDIDVGLLTGYGDYVPSLSWLESTLVFCDTHCAVVARDHPLAQRTSVSYDDLAHDKKIILGEQGLLAHEESADFDNMLCASDPQSVVVLVAAGYGISISVSHVAPHHDPKVVCLPIENSKMNIYSCVKKDANKASLNTLLKLIAEASPSLLSKQEQLFSSC